jgi:tetratricopeptide (TPR) repeat protein
MPTGSSAFSGLKVVETVLEFKVSLIFSNFRLTPLRLGLVFWLAIPSLSLGQSSEDFSHLIFEPAPVPLIPLAAREINEENAQVVPPIVSSVPATEESREQPAADLNLQNEIGRYEVSLEASLQNQDQYSQQLREQYEALGLLLQQNGEHERAISMFENAMQIDRVNTGLFTAQQIPLVKQIIESQKALGDLEEVGDMQGYLYYVHQKAFAPDSEEFLAAKETWADWNVNSYLQEGGNGLTGNYAFFGMENSASSMNDYVPIQNTVTGGFTYVPRSQLPFVLGPGGASSSRDLYIQSSQYAVPPEQMIDERLRIAEDLYEEILETRATQGLGSANSTIQHKLANISFAVKRQMDVLESQSSSDALNFNRLVERSQPNIMVTRGYTRNVKALETIAQDLENSPDASPVERAAAFINLGDWNVSYDRAQRSETAYVKAWQILRDANFTDEAITGLFQPQPPVPVPAYVIHEFSKAFYGYPADEALVYKGHIDTTLDIDRFGRVSNVRIDSTSPDTPRRVRDTLLTYLRGKKMRPTMEDGELVKLTDVKTRYYYSY